MKGPAPKVVVGYCIGEYGLIHNEFSMSLVSFVLWDQKHYQMVSDGSRILNAKSAYIPDGRNNLVKQFLDEGDQEWLWWLDYDMTFNADTLYRLMEVADPIEKPIVGGLYFVNLDQGIAPIFYDKQSRPVQEIKVGEVMEVGSTGMGCTLIHRSVFEKMRAEYDAPWHWYGHDPTVNMDGTNGICGEDITFCRRARKLGFTIWGHCGVFLDHLKTHHLSVASYANSPNVDVFSPEEIADGKHTVPQGPSGVPGRDD